MTSTLFPWLKRKAKAAKEAHGDLVEHKKLRSWLPLFP